MRTHGAATSTKADGIRRLEVITGVGRRRRWSDENKARIVAESLDPATTASAVARRHGLHASQLFTVNAVRGPPCGPADDAYG
jgi:transposase-like protein